MAYIALLAATLALVFEATKAQGAAAPNLVQNMKLRDHLQAWAAGNPCPAPTSDGVKGAIEEIRDYGYLVYVLNTRRITKEQALMGYSTNPVVNDSLVESTKTPDTAIAKDGDKDAFGTSKIAYSTTKAFAVNSGNMIDYYHWEFHLNLQGRTISSKADYIAGLKSIACTETLDWVKKHFPK